MTSRRIALAAGGLSLLFLVPLAAKEKDDQKDGAFRAANTRFAFKLFNELAARGAGQNVLISPIGVETALAMTLNGAVGDTQKAMLDVLELKDLALPEIGRAHLRLRTALEDPGLKVELAIANSLWAKKGTIFKPAFTQHNGEFFRAEITGVDFAGPHILGIINGWAKRKTKGRIQEIVSQVDPNTILFLLNAVAFKGKWTIPFDKSSTKEGDFKRLSGDPKKLPMMSQSGRYRYFHGDAFQAVVLPYGKGRVSMTVFLPDPESTLAAFQKNLTEENWGKWIPQFKETQGDVVLPRFKIEYDTELNDTLKTLGMGVAFDPERADLSNICSNPDRLYIQKVRHKSFAEVNEEGTEAAAVTSVEPSSPAITPAAEEHFRMVVDRPFFIVIRENDTGTILFMGSVVEPQ